MRFIHVGCHKCGSTFIQEEVLPKLRGIEIIFPSEESLLFQQLKPDLFRLVHTADLYFDEDLKARTFENIRRYTAYDNCCMSWEGLTGHRSMVVMPGFQIEFIAKRLKELFPQTIIFLVLRNQSEFLKSYYKDDATYGLCASFDKWLSYQQRYAGLNYARFSPLVELYQRLFGKEQVVVALFEELFRRDTFEDLFNRAGVDPAGLDDVDYQKRHNAALGGLSLEIMQILSRYGNSKLALADEESEWYRRWRFHYGPLLDKWCKETGTASVEIAQPPGYDALLKDLYHEDNLRTSKLIGRDLREFGYP